MQYKHTKEHLDYSDFSSGRVFYSLPGHPAFPVRLASEIFQRCIEFRKTIYNDTTPCTLYDPCCGAAYHLSVLACLHGEHIREILASDVDEKAVALARRNLGLLNATGLDQRVGEISQMLKQYGKDSHKDALRSAHALKEKFFSMTEKHSYQTSAFQADATDGNEIFDNIKTKSVDIVFTDIPYGRHSQWHDSDRNELSNPIGSLLEALLHILSPSSIIAIVSDKQQKVSHEKYQRIEQFLIGKRRIVILKPV